MNPYLRYVSGLSWSLTTAMICGLFGIAVEAFPIEAFPIEAFQ